MNPKTIQVLVVDDSAVVRGLLNRSLEGEADYEVAGSVRHGEDALLWLQRHHADVMLLDVEMPVMDGLTTLKCVQQLYPELPVIMVSAVTESGAESTLQALAMGAVACVAKPHAQNTAACVAQLATELVPLIRELVGSGPQRPQKSSSRSGSVSNRTTQPVSVVRPQTRDHNEPFHPEVIVIGSSTGGPRALSDVLVSIPSSVDLPILIVQHMPPMFTPMLAKHLSTDSGRPGQEARNGEALQEGTIYVAPGDWHVELSRHEGRLFTQLHQGPAEHFCRPSVNPLFRSAAACCRSSVLAIMLTGMGSDGLEGTEDIRAAGGYVIAQDEASSVVWGMPGAIVNAGLADQILPLDRIGPCVSEMLRQLEVVS